METCNHRRRPRKWWPLFDAWLCWPCMERRVAAVMRGERDDLQHV